MYRNLVSLYDVARQLGGRETGALGELQKHATALGIKALHGNYERKELRRIVARMSALSGDEETRRACHRVIAELADEPEPPSGDAGV